MKNELLSMFLIWTLLVVGFSATSVSAQTISKDSLPEAIPSPKSPDVLRSNVKAFTAEVPSDSINFEKLEKENNKELSKRKMSGKRKAMWVAIVIGGVVGMFFLIKYAKECEEYQAGCSLDEVCPCLRYREREN